VSIAILDMLPQDPIVLFVHTHGLLDQSWLSMNIIQDSIKVVNVPKAIAAQLETVGTVAKAIVSDVKGTLALKGWIGIAIGHCHFHQTTAVQNRPTLVANIMKDKGPRGS
jgi:hypothetical protein